MIETISKVDGMTCRTCQSHLLLKIIDHLRKPPRIFCLCRSFCRLHKGSGLNLGILLVEANQKTKQIAVRKRTGSGPPRGGIRA